MRQGYDELVNAIIRPPRADYDMERLGPTHFTFCGRKYRRTDMVLMNQRGLALQCSHWEPTERPNDELPCVVFMHGNSSARLEGLNQLSVCLGYGLTLFAFDCAGSGKSEGNYVSLGWFERDDLRVVVDHLRGSGSVSKIAVWGRSMGAVTGLLYQVQDAEILGPSKMSVNAMVLDSPFADFCQLAEELVAKGRERGVVVPSMVTRMALSMLANSVKSVAGFDINDLSAIKCVKKCTLPALFICAKRDDFIGTHHTQSLHDEYGGPKFIIVADGDHNTLRSSQSMLSVGTFLQRELNVPTAWMMLDAVPSFATVPWRGALNPRVATSGSFSSLTYRDDDFLDDQGVGFGTDKVAAVHNKIGNAMGHLGYKNGRPLSIEPGAFLAEDRSSTPPETQREPQQSTSSEPTFEEQQWCLDQAHYYCNRGNALEESGKIDAAIRAYRAAITYHAEYPDAHYNLGIALKNRGQVDEAIREYRRTVALKPSHADAHNNLGVALEESGAVNEAIESYRRAIEHNDMHQEAHSNLADALQSVGRIDEAIAEYHVAVAQNPGDSDTINNLGVALEANGAIADAIAAYSTAVANKPDHWDGQCNLADALQLNGDLERAAEVYAFILQHNPTNAQIASSLGNVLHARDRHSEALAAYETAVKYNPGDTITRNNMGIVLQSTGRVDEAIAAYEAALAHDPCYAIAHYNLGVALQSQKRLKDAVEAYRTAVFHRRDYADAYNNMGYALQQIGDLDAAIDAYKSAVDIRPDFASAVANLKNALVDAAKAKKDRVGPIIAQPPATPAQESRPHEIDFVLSPDEIRSRSTSYSSDDSSPSPTHLRQQPPAAARRVGPNNGQRSTQQYATARSLKKNAKASSSSPSAMLSSMFTSSWSFFSASSPASSSSSSSSSSS